METSVADVLAVVINQHFSLDNIPCAEHLYEHARSLMTAFANAFAPAGLIFQKIFPSSPIAPPPTILEAMYGESKPLLQDAPQTGLHMVRLAIPCRSNSKLLKRNGPVLQLSAPNRGAPHLDQIGQIVTQVIGSIFPQRGRNTPPRGSEERLGGGTRVEQGVENDGAIVVSGRGGGDNTAGTSKR